LNGLEPLIQNKKNFCF